LAEPPETRGLTLGEWRFDTPSRIDIAGRFGASARLDDPPHWPASARGGGLAGLGLDVYFAPRVALGLAYDYLDLGQEQSGLTTGGTLTVDRFVHTGWAELIMLPGRGDTVATYLLLAAGASWQRAAAVGMLWPEAQPSLAVPYRCQAGGAAALALRAELGLDASLGAGLHALAGVALATHALADTPLGDCVTGAGGAQTLAVRAGLGYAFDLAVEP
jgi:hypothetical protein